MSLPDLKIIFQFLYEISISTRKFAVRNDRLSYPPKPRNNFHKRLKRRSRIECYQSMPLITRISCDINIYTIRKALSMQCIYI